MAFHCAEGLEEEVKSKIFGGVETLLAGGEKCHDDVCKLFVQNLFVSIHFNVCVHSDVFIPWH
jgi:hypothetical protein